jgi:hypothetical protein
LQLTREPETGMRLSPPRVFTGTIALVAATTFAGLARAEDRGRRTSAKGRGPMSVHRRAGLRWAFIAVLVVGALEGAGCTVGDPTAHFTPTLPAGDAQFRPVGDFLQHRCGTLDCHGQIERNFKVYSGDGLRLAGDAVSGDALNPTTDDEYRTTWASIADLEPEVMQSVMADHGDKPERLTFVRKMRGTEWHAPPRLVVPGDDQDTCVTTWLGGHTDVDACTKAVDPAVYP